MNLVAGMSWSSTGLEFGLELAAKSTVMLVFVLVIQNVLGRRRAFLGSAVGNAGLIGLLLLPFSSLILPSLAIPCLPAWTNAGTLDSVDAAISQSAGTRTRDFAADAMTIDPTLHSSPVGPQSEVRLFRASDAPAPARLTTAAPAGAQPMALRQPNRTDWAPIAVVIYAVIALALLARLASSIGAVARLRRSCVQVDRAEWTEALKRWRGRLGIGRDVVLARSPRVSVPVALGWLRPTIVLPDSLTGSGSAGSIDAVLLHELSHVRRGDYAWNVILRVVQAVYWPHVLVWVLGRAIAFVRERVCDDLCVHALGGPAAYRDALLAVASGIVRRPSPALGLAMARTSKLARRLARIERSAGDHRFLAGWPATLMISTMAIAAAGVIGAAQLVRAEPPKKTPDDSPKAAGPAPAASNAGRVFHLKVVAAGTNEPVPDAEVRVRNAMRSEWRQTDAQGRLDLVHSTGPSDRILGIDVWGKGRAMQRRFWDNDSNQPVPESETIALQPGETLGGLMQDEAGRPIAGATVYLWSYNHKKKDPHEALYQLRAVSGPDGKWQTSGAPETTGELFGFKIVHPDFLSVRDYSQEEIIPKIADLRAGKAVTVMKKGVPIEGRVVDGDGKPVAGARVLSADHERAVFTYADPFVIATDAAGHFRTGQVKPGAWFLVAMAKGHAPGDQKVMIGTAVPQVEIKLGRPRVFKGRVVDRDGKPVAGAYIDPDVWRGHRGLGVLLWTGADGRFRWDDAPNDELIVNVNATGYRGVFQERVAPTSEEVVFTLVPSLAIRGKLVDAETKKRIDNALVEYSALDPATGRPLKWTNLPRFGSGTGVHQGNLDANFPVTDSVYKLRIRSAGYLEFVSRAFRREEKVVLGFDVALRPGTAKPAGDVATVLGPSGKPLAGARLVEIQHVGGVTIENGVPNLMQSNRIRETRTSPQGEFEIPSFEHGGAILILGDDSFAFAGTDSLKRSRTLRATPYGQIEGRCFVGGRAVPDQELELHGELSNRSTRSGVSIRQTVKTDKEGRFTFRSVIPTRGIRIARKDRDDAHPRFWSLGEPVRVEPGATRQVILGGTGRPVIGRVEPPEGWAKPIDFTDRSEARIDSNQPWAPTPVSLFRGKTSLPGNEIMAWNERWSNSPESWDYAERRVSMGVLLAPDGSFRIDDVPPGDYRLAVRVNGEPAFLFTSVRMRDSGPFLRIVRTFTMPEVPRARKDPLDLGVIELQPRVAFEAGQPAPTFDVTTIDGKKLVVPRDFRGKFLLLDFGTMWDIQARHQIPPLNDVYEKFGQGPDPRLAILTLTSAPDTAATREFIAEKGEPWPQAIIGPLSNPITSLYGIDDDNVSTVTLIGPDGRIVAAVLWGQRIGEAVGKALGGADQ
ncbi:MAG: carboxypeptidase regulatory-like domain-containing protein [Isosphaeraceae bacterium]